MATKQLQFHAKLQLGFLLEPYGDALRWDTLQPHRACKQDNLENSNMEKISTFNQQLRKILMALVVAISYVWFTAPMTFCVLSTLINS
jgi:hypothetical protein